MVAGEPTEAARFQERTGPRSIAPVLMQPDGSPSPWSLPASAVDA